MHGTQFPADCDSTSPYGSAQRRTPPIPHYTSPPVPARPDERHYVCSRPAHLFTSESVPEQPGAEQRGAVIARARKSLDAGSDGTARQKVTMGRSRCGASTRRVVRAGFLLDLKKSAKRKPMETNMMHSAKDHAHIDTQRSRSRSVTGASRSRRNSRMAVATGPLSAVPSFSCRRLRRAYFSRAASSLSVGSASVAPNERVDLTLQAAPRTRPRVHHAVGPRTGATCSPRVPPRIDRQRGIGWRAAAALHIRAHLSTLARSSRSRTRILGEAMFMTCGLSKRASLRRKTGNHATSPPPRRFHGYSDVPIAAEVETKRGLRLISSRLHGVGAERLAVRVVSIRGVFF